MKKPKEKLARKLRVKKLEQQFADQIDAARSMCLAWAQARSEQSRRVAYMTIIEAAQTLTEHCGLTFTEPPGDARCQVAYYVVDGLDVAVGEQIYNMICRGVILAEQDVVS